MTPGMAVAEVQAGMAVAEVQGGTRGKRDCVFMGIARMRD
jgi:hypothetical protein